MTGRQYTGNTRLRLSCTVKETGNTGADQEVILPIRNPPRPTTPYALGTRTGSPDETLKEV
jgi:hypothetical protein